MKESVAYIATFVFAFILVTSAMFVVNEKYNNVFRFDFSPRSDSLSVKPDSLKHAQDSLAKIKNDSVLAVQHADSLKKAATDSAISGSEGANNAQVAEKSHSAEKRDRLSDTSYVKWKQKTLKQYDKMESKLIAKLLTNYDDAVARDLFYSLKEKKAAEVLNYLSAEVAQRLTKAP